VVTLHGGYETLGLETLLIHLCQVQAVDQFVYAAAKNLRSFPEQFLARSRFTRIPNALPTSASAAQDRAVLGIGGDDAIIAMLISRAIPGKGWQLAIEAVEDARVATARDIHLALIGNGPVYDDLRTIPTPDWLHLLGVQGEIRSWISIADIGLLPSTFSGESYPLVLIDFLTMGVPVITSAAGEIPQMMACDLGTPGYVVDETDEVPLEERVAVHLAEFVALDAQERADLRRRALATAEKFSFRQMVEAYEQVYEQVCAG
jgi:glycosyltransferase involved in cell wall biosynthesis